MADRLDERLTGALGEAPGPAISAADLALARDAVVGELRRRRTQRRAGGAAMLAAAVVLAGGTWAAVRWWPSPAGPGASRAATAGPARAAPVAPRETCARVVGTARCVGTVSTAPTSASELAPAAGSYANGEATAPADLGQTLDLRVGHTATLVLPSGGAAWSQPHPGFARGSSSAGGAAGATGAVVHVGRVSPVGQRRSARVQTVTVAGVVPGRVQVVASTTCRESGASSAGAGCSARQWTVEVEVAP